jgi:hypothetical protein
MLTNEQLIELYDKQKLHENLMEYCRGVDRMDVDILRETYWPDSADDHGVFVGGGLEWCDEAVKYKHRLYSVSHHVSNVLIKLEGDRAKRESLFFLVTEYRDPPVTTFKGGRYRDLCEKRAGE